jgi:hypothetical protein
MSKPTKSLIGSKREQPIQGESLTKLYGSPETLAHMRQCEAREWISRWRQKAMTDGVNSSNNWWRKTIMDIERIRGLEAAIELRTLMNKERKK